MTPEATVKRPYSLGSGRTIELEGKPIARIARYVESGHANVSPTECDELAARIVRLLNGDVP